MPKIRVALKIDVSKIDKDRLYKGAKGTYLDASLYVDLDQADQYGNHGMITQQVSKEEREAGTKGAILGNGKIIWRDDGAASVPSAATATAPAGDFDDSDIPF